MATLPTTPDTKCRYCDAVAGLHEDACCKVAVCVCGRLIVIYRHHGSAPTVEEEAQMERALTERAWRQNRSGDWIIRREACCGDKPQHVRWHLGDGYPL
jgi:hypothetical protein